MAERAQGDTFLGPGHRDGVGEVVRCASSAWLQQVRSVAWRLRRRSAVSRPRFDPLWSEQDPSDWVEGVEAAVTPLSATTCSS